MAISLTQLKLSEGLVSSLEQEVSDLASVTEQYEVLLNTPLPCDIPTSDVLMATCCSFSSAREEMDTRSGEALGRLQHLIDSWVLYHKGKEDLLPCVEGVELRLKQLTARHEGVTVPRASPHDLLMEAEVGTSWVPWGRGIVSTPWGRALLEPLGEGIVGTPRRRGIVGTVGPKKFQMDKIFGWQIFSDICIFKLR